MFFYIFNFKIYCPYSLPVTLNCSEEIYLRAIPITAYDGWQTTCAELNCGLCITTLLLWSTLSPIASTNSFCTEAKGKKNRSVLRQPLDCVLYTLCAAMCICFCSVWTKDAVFWVRWLGKTQYLCCCSLCFNWWFMSFYWDFSLRKHERLLHGRFSNLSFVFVNTGLVLFYVCICLISLQFM